MNLLRPLSLLLLLAVTLPAAAAEGEGLLRLNTFLDKLKTMEAHLNQTQYDAEGKLLDEGEGTLLVERPGKFRLQYHSPYRALYLADGERVTIYDEDLEQITIKHQTRALGSTPATLLSGEQPLEENFAIKELGKHEGYYWLELDPKDPEANFDFIRIAVEGYELRAMEMVDNFGQTTRLYFSDIKRNIKLDKDAFAFTPPEGVDVITE